MATYLESCRTKRNVGTYDRGGGISDTEADELLSEAKALMKTVEAWLKKVTRSWRGDEDSGNSGDDQATLLVSCRRVATRLLAGVRVLARPPHGGPEAAQVITSGSPHSLSAMRAPRILCLRASPAGRATAALTRLASQAPGNPPGARCPPAG